MNAFPVKRTLSGKIAFRWSRLGPHGHMMAVLFLVFSFFDWFFSMIAFHLGITEGNPFLAWCQQRFLFTPVKMILSLVITLMILGLYYHRHARIVTYFGVLFMGIINAYHIVALSALLAA